MAKNKFSHILKFVGEIKNRKQRIADFMGLKLMVSREVFPVDSGFSFSSRIVAKAIPRNAGKVLDLGTGTGVQAIIAAKKGAKKVVAVDIDESSIKNAAKNVKLHKLGVLVEVRKSNLFSKIRKSEKFDLIIANLPFADAKYKGEFGHFLFDRGLRLHKKLLKQSKKYLAENGRLLVASGEISNEKLLFKLAEKYGYKVSKANESRFKGFAWRSYFLKP